MSTTDKYHGLALIPKSIIIFTMNPHACCQVYAAANLDPSSLRSLAPPPSFRPAHIIRLLRSLKNRRTLKGFRPIVRHLAKFIPHRSFSHYVEHHLRCLLTPTLGLLTILVHLQAHGASRRLHFFVFVKSLKYLLSRKFCHHLHGSRRPIAFNEDVIESWVKWKFSCEERINRVIDGFIDDLKLTALLKYLIKFHWNCCTDNIYIPFITELVFCCLHYQNRSEYISYLFNFPTIGK